MNGLVTRQTYESLGPKGFARKVCHLIGLADEGGKRYPQLNSRSSRQGYTAWGKQQEPLDTHKFSLRNLAEVTLGSVERGQSLMTSTAWTQAIQEQAQAKAENRPIMEDTGAAAVPPSSFADINAFTSVVAGLLEIEVMKGWEYPDFIMDDIMPERGTRMFDGRKVIGTA